MKHVLRVEVDEEIQPLIDRIKRFKGQAICLVFPRKALIFQSGINLELLKRQAEAQGNSLELVSADRIGRHLAQKAGIPSQASLQIPSSAILPPQEVGMRIEPIQARRNSLPREAPQRIEKKMTIGQLVTELREKAHKASPLSSKKAADLSLPSSRPFFLPLLLLLSVGIFGLISYVALPGATVYIRPAFEPIDHSLNVLLADRRSNQRLLNQNQPNVIASQKIETTAKQTKIFSASTKQFNGSNATGEVTLINSSQEEWRLRQGTRFQSPEGLIFRSKNWVTVAAAAPDESGKMLPGKQRVSVEADPFDRYNKPIGERGNIPPSRFTLPNLSSSEQKVIWAESSAPFSGGAGSYSLVVTEEDVESAKKQVEESLILVAREELQALLEESNRLNQTHLVLLDDRRQLKTSIVEMKVSEGLVGSFRDKFQIYAEISAQGIAYDADQLLALMRKELRARTHPQMQLKEDSVVAENIRYEVLEENPSLGQTKITATIEGIQEYVIDSSLEAGLRFSSRIKERIAGMPLEEAEAYLNNLPEVEEAEIRTWPLWLSSMPRLAEKIRIRLLEGG